MWQMRSNEGNIESEMRAAISVETLNLQMLAKLEQESVSLRKV